MSHLKKLKYTGGNFSHIVDFAKADWGVKLADESMIFSRDGEEFSLQKGDTVIETVHVFSKVKHSEESFKAL